MLSRRRNAPNLRAPNTGDVGRRPLRNGAQHVGAILPMRSRGYMQARGAMRIAPGKQTESPPTPEGIATECVKKQPLARLIESCSTARRLKRSKPTNMRESFSRSKTHGDGDEAFFCRGTLHGAPPKLRTPCNRGRARTLRVLPGRGNNARRSWGRYGRRPRGDRIKPTHRRIGVERAKLGRFLHSRTSKKNVVHFSSAHALKA